MNKNMSKWVKIGFLNTSDTGNPNAVLVAKLIMKIKMFVTCAPVSFWVLLKGYLNRNENGLPCLTIRK